MLWLIPLWFASTTACQAATEAAGDSLTAYTVATATGVTLRLPGYRGGPVYYRNRAGKWVEAQTSGGESPNTTQLTLAAADLATGKTTVVLNKPEWVQLDDAEAPRVVRVQCAGEAVALKDGAAEVPAISPGQTIEVQVEDQLNRISLAGTAATLNDVPLPAGAGLTIQREDGNPKRAVLRYVVPAGLGFGRQELKVCVRDEAPVSPSAEITLSCRQFGVEVAGDGGQVVFHTPAASFTCAGTMRGIFGCDMVGAPAVRLAVQGRGSFQHPEKLLAPPKVLVDQPERKVVSLKPSLVFDESGEQVRQFELELVCEIRADWPGLLVTTKLTALEDLPKSYLFWSGFMSGDYYVGSDGSRGEWHPRYADIKPQGWIYLSPTAPDRPGAGVVSDGELSEYLGQSLLVFTKPKTLDNAKKGDVMQVSWCYFPAASPDAVSAHGRRASAHAAVVEMPRGDNE
jgi:hypothetical protein